MRCYSDSGNRYCCNEPSKTTGNSLDQKLEITQLHEKMTEHSSADEITHLDSSETEIPLKALLHDKLE